MSPVWIDIGGVTPGWNWPEGLLSCWSIGVVVLRAEVQVGLVVNEGGGGQMLAVASPPVTGVDDLFLKMAN